MEGERPVQPNEHQDQGDCRLEGCGVLAADNVSFFRHLNIGLRPSKRALIRP